MPALRRCAVSIFAFAAAAASLPVSAQIIEIRESNGKQIYCAQSGLRGFAMPCGMDTSNDYVLIGSVLSAVQISEREKRLLVAPEEIFHGNPPRELSVTTSQGDCLPQIQPGDRWLFYLWRDKETQKLLLGYASGSAPVAEAQGSIALLRRLTQLLDSGLIRGYVSRAVWDDDGKARPSLSVPRHKIMAKRAVDGVEYSTLTDLDGNYEFEPLPPGSYHLTANTAEGVRAWEGSTSVHAHGCSRIGFELQPDSLISGRVRTASGKPAKSVQVAVMPVSTDGEFSSAFTDEDGYFEIRSLRPGHYLVGVNIQAQQGSPEWRRRVYYPGVRSRDLAVTIELGLAEKRTSLNFELPAK